MLYRWNKSKWTSKTRVHWHWHSVSTAHTQISYFRNTTTLRDTQNHPFLKNFSFFLLFLLKDPKNHHKRRLHLVDNFSLALIICGFFLKPKYRVLVEKIAEIIKKIKNINAIRSNDIFKFDLLSLKLKFSLILFIFQIKSF